MRKQNQNRAFYIVVAVLACILTALVVWAVILSTQPSSVPTETTTTVAPTATQTPSTAPSNTTTSAPTDTGSTSASTGEAGEEMVGSLYSRAFLESLNTTVQEYGPGKTSDGNRPPYADPLQEKYAQYGANFIAPEGQVYLTFDCGYEYTHTDENGNQIRVTEWILDTLKEKGVKAVFFVTMDYCKTQPALVQRMIDEGHAVGNHSTTHPVIPGLSIDQMVEEVMTLHEYVKEHFGYEMHLFRPPEGKYSEQSLAVVQSLGYKTVHWSFAYADWDPANQPTVESGYQTVTERHHDGAIYLLHAVSVTNATILSDVIDFMLAQNYTLGLFQ